MACLETSLESPINELPDDILVHILSCLTLKEAGQTSILSKRWRNIWAYVPTLNFDNDKFLLDFFAGDRSNQPVWLSISAHFKDAFYNTSFVSFLTLPLVKPTKIGYYSHFTLLSLISLAIVSAFLSLLVLPPDGIFRLFR